MACPVPRVAVCTHCSATQDWTLPLHEARVSPATLAHLGVRSCSWLLLEGIVPCIGLAAAEVPDGTAMVPSWMLHHFGLNSRGGKCSLAPLAISSSQVANVELELAIQKDPLHDENNGYGDADLGEEEEKEGECSDTMGDPVRAQMRAHRRAAMHPFDAAAVRAARRQLHGVPIFEGALCAVQRLHGVCVFRVARLQSDGISAVQPNTGVAIQPTTWIGIKGSTGSTTAAAAAAATAAAAAPAAESPTLKALYAHALTLLCKQVGRPGTRASDLTAAAIHGGHVLLCGPPGNGKRHTLSRLAAILGGSIGVRVHRLRCTSLLAAADSGSLEAVMSGAFDTTAQGAPTVLLLDDLRLLSGGASASAAVEDSSRSGVEQQVAAALVARMRAAPPGVLVLGTALAPQMLPTCLRGHGGFEVIFELPPHTADERTALLLSWLPGEPESCARGESTGTSEAGTDLVGTSQGGEAGTHLAGTDKLSGPIHAPTLSRLTAGYSLRDLRRLLTAIFLRAAARDSTPTWDDAKAMIRSLRPSDASSLLALPAITGAESTWARFGGYDSLKARLERLLQVQLAHASAARSPSIGADGEAVATLGVLQPPSGALLYGPPGNGKSLLAASLADATGWPALVVKGSQLFGAYVGDTEASIRELFRTARERAPSIIVLDELDALGASRGEIGDSGGDGHGSSSVAERALSTLLNEMDGVGVSGPALAGVGSDVARPPVFLIGCTNAPELVDSALLRPGRLEQLLYLPYPDHTSREAVLRVHASRLPLHGDVELSAIASETEGLSCAALAALCRGAAQHTLARHMCKDAHVPVEVDASDNSSGSDESDEGGESEGEMGGDVCSIRAQCSAGEASGLDVTMLDFTQAMQKIMRRQALSPLSLTQLQLKYEKFGLGGVRP
jgi:SpoVK/Ycf46/Vps4 family AAA+-type ATPase